MCAINGLFSYRPTAPAVDPAELRATRDHMAARGPDGQGAWLSPDGRLGLGHRRLAIIDLSAAAAQPMAGRYHLVFNGEIYNHRALRRELEAHGSVFRTHSDTEVILHLFARRFADQGPALLLALRGMYALALWDSARRQLLLARDPYGIKPLYYADDGSTLRFASQVKALLAGGALSRDPDPAGLVGFHLFGHVPEPFTWYRAIHALPAGHSLLIDERGPGTPVAYHRIAQVYADAEAGLDPLPPTPSHQGRGSHNSAGLHPLPPITAPSPQPSPARGEGARSHSAASSLPSPLVGEGPGERGIPPSPGERGGTPLRDALLDSVRHHLEADVPVGAFLSAGIDSGALVGLMRDAGARDLQTLTLSFGEFQGRPDDEAPLATAVARHYGTRHTTRRVTAAEFHADLPLILAAMDQPSIDGINTWFIAKAARELGLKVAVSGLGGDELFGGYPSFTDLPRWVRWLAPAARVPALGRGLRRLATLLVGGHRDENLAMASHGRPLPPPAHPGAAPTGLAAFNAVAQAQAPPSAVGGPPGTAGCGRATHRPWHLPPKLPGLLEYGGTYAGAYLLRRGLFMPWELEALLDPLYGPGTARAGLERLDPLRHIEAQLHPGPRGAFARVATLEASLYMRNQLLRDTDWASMAHGLEIRVPLVDAHLLAQVAPLTCRAFGQPQGQGQRDRTQTPKHWLALAPSQPLPDAIRHRPKTGFGTPLSHWLSDPTAAPGAPPSTYGYSRGWAQRLVAPATAPTTTEDSGPNSRRLSKDYERKTAPTTTEDSGPNPAPATTPTTTPTLGPTPSPALLV